MLENQFIKFNRSYNTWQGSVMPVVIGTSIMSDYPYKIYVPGDVISIDVVDSSNVVLRTENFTAASTPYVSRRISGLLYYAGLSVGDRFVLRSYNGSTYKYTGVLVRVPGDGMTHLRYSCNEDAFGFPFSDDGGEVAFSLPILLSAPQFIQEDKTYVKANGEVVTLYAKYYREWEGETEYLSAEMHEKIMVALSCDNVYTNGLHVAKSDKYEIAWDQYDLDCDGVTKLARATFKVRENITQRNSNY